MKKQHLTKELDHALAAPMFILSLVVLSLFAALLHLNELEHGGVIVQWCLIGLACSYPVFWIETLAHVLIGSRFRKQHIWFCLFPLTRIGARDHETGQEVWLPIGRWREVNRPLERVLARRFSIPMIAIALMVLPIIVMEFFYKDFIESSEGWLVAMKITEAFIWAAFTFEFILMLWIVKYPISYAKKHWIDLAIILLPTLAFMRTLRLASIGRLNQLSRTARVYRLRGLAMRMWRGFVALELIELLLSRNPARRLEKLEVQLEDRMEEINLLKKDISRLRTRVQNQKAETEAKEKAEAEEERQSSPGEPNTIDSSPERNASFTDPVTPEPRSEGGTSAADDNQPSDPSDPRYTLLPKD